MKKLLTLFTLLLTVCSGAWADYTYEVTSSTATTDNGKNASPRYTITFDGGVLMKNNTGSSSWSASSTTISETTVYYLATGSSTFTFKTTNAITGFVIYGTAGTGSSRTISSVKTSTTMSDYTAVSYNAVDGINSKTAIGYSTVTSTIPANTYVEVTFSGNIYLTQLILKTPTTPTLTGAWKLGETTKTSDAMVEGSSAPTMPTFTIGATSGTPTSSDYTVTYAFKSGYTTGIFQESEGNPVVTDGQPQLATTPVAGSATIIATLTTADNTKYLTPTTNTFEYTLTVSAASAPEFTSVTSDPSPANVGKNDEVTFTAVVTGTPTPTVNWYECNSIGGERSASKGTGLTYSPTTDALGTKYYIAVASNGVDPNAESDVLSVTVTGSNLCKLLEAKYSNGFNSFINEGSKTVTVYYMEGTDAPTVTGTPVVSDGATYDVSDVTKIIVTAEDETTTATYTVTRTAVSPYTTAGELAFDGTETSWIKTGNTFDDTKKWRFSKNDNDWTRETPGQNRIYFFVGPASSIELKTTANVDKGSARNIHVYVNGVKNNDISVQAPMGSYLTIPCNENTNNMVEILSNQTNGDGCISHIINHTVVPVTVTDAKYATFASTEDLDFSGVDGLSAYTASVANTTVTFNEVTGSVKAGDGLLLYADVDANTTYYVPVATDSPAKVNDNKLVRGTGESLTYDYGAEYYILSKEGEDVGFYKANGNVVATNKAYLDLTGTNAKSFALPGSETDGIKSVQGSRFTVNGEAYNLAGQRVGKDYKGIVIVNGKKMLNK